MTHLCVSKLNQTADSIDTLINKLIYYYERKSFGRGVSAAGVSVKKIQASCDFVSSWRRL